MGVGGVGILATSAPKGCRLAPQDFECVTRKANTAVNNLNAKRALGCSSYVDGKRRADC